MKYSFVFFMILFGSFLQGEDFHVSIRPTASELSIKDILQVEMDFTFPEGYQIDVDALRKNILRSSNFYENAFALVDMKINPPEKNLEGALSQHISLVLQPLRVGQLPLTFYDIVFKSAHQTDQIHKIVSPIFPIHIEQAENSTQFAGNLSPLMTFSKNFPLQLNEQNQKKLENLALEASINEHQMNIKRLPWIEVLALLLILLAFWVFLKNPVVKPPLTEEEKALEAKKSALSDLDKLKSKNLPRKGFFDEYYVGLTNPVRNYIEKRYDIAAPVSTTSEFLKSVSKDPHFPPETRHLLGQFLIQADKVKFARYQPSLEECDQAQQLATQFIQSDPIKSN